MSLYYGVASMWIEMCRENCYDLSNLQAAGEQLSQKKLWMKDKFDTGLLFSNLFIFKEKILGKVLTAAVFILVGKWPDIIEVLAVCHQDFGVEETLVWGPKRRR